MPAPHQAILAPDFSRPALPHLPARSRTNAYAYALFYFNCQDAAVPWLKAQAVEQVIHLALVGNHIMPVRVDLRAI